MAGEWKGKDKSLDHSPAQRFEARPMTGKCDGSVTSLRDPTSDTLLALPPPWHSDTPPTECHTPPQRRHTHFHAHPTVTNLQGEKVCEYCMPLLLMEMYSYHRNMFGMYRKSTLSEKWKCALLSIESVSVWQLPDWKRDPPGSCRARQGSRPHARSREGDAFQCPDPPMLATDYIPFCAYIPYIESLHFLLAQPSFTVKSHIISILKKYLRIGAADYSLSVEDLVKL